MPEKRPLRYSKVVKLLKRHQIHASRKRGKGSHRVFYDDHGNFFPVPCHKKDPELDPRVIDSIIRKFNLPEEEFYGS
jgi:predicted RNA binding protein YcfA (HicA-like mRNA interferase family)